MTSIQPRRPQLVLVPGLLCDASVWRPQVEAFGGDADIHVPELTTFRSIEAMAERVLATAPDRFSLCGHSMGGRVALEIVRRAPGRVERLALLDTGVHAMREGEVETRMALVNLAPFAPRACTRSPKSGFRRWCTSIVPATAL